MSFDPYEFDRSYTPASQNYSLGHYTAKTFLWVMLGLLVTGVVMVACWATRFTLYVMYTMPYIHLIALVATLILSVTMARRIEKMGVGTAITMFLLFSAIFGFTLSIYLFVYELMAVVLCFLLTGVYFGALAAYGYLTKRDLTGLGPILFSGLISSSFSGWCPCLSLGWRCWIGSSAWWASPSSWVIPPMTPRRSNPTTTTTPATRICWPRRRSSPPCSSTWISSTSSCTCCASWATGGIEGCWSFLASKDREKPGTTQVPGFLLQQSPG